MSEKGSGFVSVEALAIVTSLLVALLLHRKMGQHGIEDEKALRKQDRRQTSATDEPIAPTGAPRYSATPRR
ncbi:hypothetical protein [Candidatus Accumulibacter sp. ACC003]|uniref:hypothetical protein n=1 Tax=Candidatus Accumulibacter sp. ACC003 TaxID=2823334 RepID=UPI0025BF5D57|nr:hypothetical protein [Candidatus Accumulibacter sp. ACC003]